MARDLSEAEQNSNSKIRVNPGIINPPARRSHRDAPADPGSRISEIRRREKYIIICIARFRPSREHGCPAPVQYSIRAIERQDGKRSSVFARTRATASRVHGELKFTRRTHRVRAKLSDPEDLLGKLRSRIVRTSRALVVRQSRSNLWRNGRGPEPCSPGRTSAAHKRRISATGAGREEAGIGHSKKKGRHRPGIARARGHGGASSAIGARRRGGVGSRTCATVGGTLSSECAVFVRGALLDVDEELAGAVTLFSPRPNSPQRKRERERRKRKRSRRNGRRCSSASWRRPEMLDERLHGWELRRTRGEAGEGGGGGGEETGGTHSGATREQLTATSEEQFAAAACTAQRDAAQGESAAEFEFVSVPIALLAAALALALALAGLELDAARAPSAKVRVRRKSAGRKCIVRASVSAGVQRGERVGGY
ncbi:hypothetical protein FB451DRAFT_1187537 [Mycena latifolia]|nr:hypothetical protein FB451DRAFT_1187537 [Mycena latifolia]